MINNDPSDPQASAAMSPATAAVFRHLVDALSTQYAAERTVHSIRQWTRTLSFLGVGQPLLLGLCYARIGDGPLLKGMQVLLALATIPLAFLSLWSIIDKWDDRYAFVIKSAVANRNFAERLQSILDTPSPTEQDLTTQHRKVLDDAGPQNDQDATQFRDWEKRYGHRKSLKKLGRECATCRKRPTDMNSTNCDTCGRFGMTDRLLWR